MEVEGSSFFYHEDDYCQIQLLPIENYPELIKQAENISESSKLNFDGSGYKNIVIRANQRTLLKDRGVKNRELEKLLSKLKVERHNIVTTGFGFSYRVQSKNTVAYGKEPSGILYDFDNQTEEVENIWLINPSRLESVELQTVISEIAKKWNLVLMDWNSLTLLDWENLDDVDTYFKTR